MRTAAVTLFIIGCLTLSVIEFRSFNMKNINAFLKDQADNQQTPSIQYAFFDTNSIFYELRYGFKNVKSEEEVDVSTIYHLYSVTKTFTALSVLQLVQEGKVGLDRPVSDYLPEFLYPAAITVKQLLSHTAGIPNPLPLKWIHLAEEHPGFNRDKFFAEIFKAHPGLEF
jgi:CubicO group peptidase (beta-lactamase class C family)